MTKIQFGTDGWRGRMADDYTFANVRRCAQGYADWLLDGGHAGKTVVVGYDKRQNHVDYKDETPGKDQGLGDD